MRGPHHSTSILRLMLTGSTLLMGTALLLTPRPGAPRNAAPRRVGPGPLRARVRMSSNRPGPEREASDNWCGYSVPDVADVVDVKGVWIVPSVTPSLAANTASTTWLGIDGDGSTSVEQLGTEQSWSEQGGARYAAWFELYPFPTYYIDAPVSPGDTISAEVAYLGESRFGLLMTDVTQNWTFQRVWRLPGARRVSAEWITEAPSDALSLLTVPLANFGAVSFSNCQATIGNRTGVLGSWPSRKALALMGRDGPEATPGPVGRDGGSFTVTCSKLKVESGKSDTNRRSLSDFPLSTFHF
jgi:hypothetical protein